MENTPKDDSEARTVLDMDAEDLVEGRLHNILSYSAGEETTTFTLPPPHADYAAVMEWMEHKPLDPFMLIPGKANNAFSCLYDDCMDILSIYSKTEASGKGATKKGILRLGRQLFGMPGI